MLDNRIHKYWNQPEQPIADAASGPAAAAFVPCPSSISRSLTAAQQSQIEQLYRLAYEQAQAQLSLNQRGPRHDFSMN